MPNRTKVSVEKKIEIVNRYERGELSLTEAARMCNVDQGSVYSWTVRYRSEGSVGFEPRTQNRVYAPALKLQAVETYLEGKGSLQAICERFCISNTRVLRDWIKVYNSGRDFTHKMSGGSRMKATRETTQEERVQIAKECIETDNNYGLIAKEHGVSYQQARTWTLKYKELGDAGLEDRRGQAKRDQQPRTELEQAQIEIEKLKRQLYLSEMENNVLKKLQEIERSDAWDK